MKRADLVALAVIAAVVGGGVAWALHMSSYHGGPAVGTLEPYVARYVELLNAGDEAGLREHLAWPSRPDDAAARIAAYGHLDLGAPSLSRVEYFELVKGSYHITITAETGSGEAVRFREVVRWDGDRRWHTFFTGYPARSWRMMPLEPEVG